MFHVFKILVDILLAAWHHPFAMQNATLTKKARRITVDFDPVLADAIDTLARARSTVIRKVTVSDIIREAVASFVLPVEGTNRSHNGTNTTESRAQGGSMQ